MRALRRRGYILESIFEFVKRTGVAKTYSLVDIDLLEHCIREELNTKADRRIAVINPVKIIITNFPEDKVKYFPITNNPSNPESEVRLLPFSRELFIERENFAEVPPPKFFRLKPGGEVRLMGAYIIKCNDLIKDNNGNITEILCTCDNDTGGKILPTAGKLKEQFIGCPH